MQHKTLACSAISLLILACRRTALSQVGPKHRAHLASKQTRFDEDVCVNVRRNHKGFVRAHAG